MDIFAHALWATAGATKLNDKLIAKKKTRVSIAWSAFWSIFPDLFAFIIPTVLSIYSIIFTDTTFRSLSHHGPSLNGNDSIFSLASNLYQYSHSIIIFCFVFGIVWFFYKKPQLVMLGWLLHILIDIPSHSINFYPTPFLFPISNYHFQYGIAWSNSYFMIVNYSLLLIVFVYLFFVKNKKSKLKFK